MMNSVLFFVTIYFIPVFVQGQTLTLFDYRQQDSITNCSYRLLGGVDQVVFKSQVTLTPNATSGIVTFSILDNNDLTKVYFVTENQILNGQCQSTHEISCTMIDTHTFLLTVRFTAYSQFSGARIRGQLTTPDGKVILSEDQPLPMIKDSIESHGVLSINHHLLEEEKACDLVVNDPELKILFTCYCSGEPCMVELTTSDSAVHLLHRNNVEYRKLYQTPDKIDVDIKYGACSLRLQPHSIKCHITLDFPSALEYNDNRHTQLFILLPLILTIVIVLFLLAAFLRIRNTKSGFSEMEATHFWRHLANFMNVHKTKKYEDDEATDCSSREKNEQQYNDSIKLLSEGKYENKAIVCEKDPDHKQFVKIIRFSTIDLPEAYRKEDVLNLVKAMAFLTVKVKTRPGHSKLSGFNNKDASTETNVKFGTGFITELQFVVGTEETSCRCRTCKLSGQDNKVAGKILIETSTAVIDSDQEAENSEFEVSYKSEWGFTLILRGNRLAMSDKRKGFCLVECETCSGEFLDYLDSKRKQCEKLMSEVNNLYTNSVDEKRLCIIVSHPHGSSKRVSFGEWTRKTDLETQKSEMFCRYEYTTPTCPGSAGAFVYILGVSDVSHRPNHLHWGSNDEGINSSSFGIETTTGKETKLKFLRC